MFNVKMGTLREMRDLMYRHYPNMDVATGTNISALRLCARVCALNTLKQTHAGVVTKEGKRMCHEVISSVDEKLNQVQETYDDTQLLRGLKLSSTTFESTFQYTQPLLKGVGKAQRKSPSSTFTHKELKL